ncbi:MAG TPA: FAD-dependent oxidoreductase [Thermosynechococcaceae cyanobacterium]
MFSGAVLGGASCLGLFLAASRISVPGSAYIPPPNSPVETSRAIPVLAPQNGRPQLSPLPAAEEVWECEVVVVGGSLGGIAAASQSMKSGAKTCLIELTPWFGGQVSAQGVSAIDESSAMLERQNFSKSWQDFKQLVKQQTVQLPAWVRFADTAKPDTVKVEDLNSCWVGKLCFTPQAGAAAALQQLKMYAAQAPGSRWGSSIAFKGAEFDRSGKDITAVYAVRRAPRQANYAPQGRLSAELESWYAWADDAVFDKSPLRLQAPANKRMIVIDATDTGEVVGWANLPHRIGSDSKSTTGEYNAANLSNSDCTQAFTFPFVLAIHDDRGKGKKFVKQITSQLEGSYTRSEHRSDYSLMTFPVFGERSFFNYRRIVSTTKGNPLWTLPSPGDMTIVNWNKGNDWPIMDDPLILTEGRIDASGQRQNWTGGLSVSALRHAEEHALLFAEWLMEKAQPPEYPFAYLSGADSPLGTVSGLSMYPYIREGRRILGRPAYGQQQFMMREADVRNDMTSDRNFSPTAIAVTHYDVDIHGCRYRNGGPTWEAKSAPADEHKVRPVEIPLEALIPQGVDNLLIGGKTIAVSHIANAVTRVHHGEWQIGSAAGTTAAWLIKQAAPSTTPASIVPQGSLPQLREYMVAQGLRYEW